MDINLGTIILIIIVLVCFAALIWAAERYLTLPQPFKGLIIFLLVVVAVFVVLNTFGVFGGRGHVRVGSLEWPGSPWTTMTRSFRTWAMDRSYLSLALWRP